jgi:hypothetical protein
MSITNMKVFPKKKKQYKFDRERKILCNPQMRFGGV